MGPNPSSFSTFWVLFWVIPFFEQLFWVAFFSKLTFLSTFLSKFTFLSTFLSDFYFFEWFLTFLSTFLSKILLFWVFHFFEYFFEYFFETFGHSEPICTKVERNQNHVKNFVGERLTLSYGLYEERTFPPLHYLLLVSGERCGVGEGLCAVETGELVVPGVAVQGFQVQEGLGAEVAREELPGGRGLGAWGREV